MTEKSFKKNVFGTTHYTHRNVLPRFSQFQKCCQLKFKRTKNYSLANNALDCAFGSFHKRQKPKAPTPQAPIRNRQTRKGANAKDLNRNTNLT